MDKVNMTLILVSGKNEDSAEKPRFRALQLRWWNMVMLNTKKARGQYVKDKLITKVGVTKKKCTLPNQFASFQDWFSEFYHTQRTHTAWCKLKEGGAGKIRLVEQPS